MNYVRASAIWRRNWPFIPLLVGIMTAMWFALAHAGTGVPATEDDAILDAAAWIYAAVKQGDWRLVISGVLLILVAGWRKIPVEWLRRLEAKAWYRDHALPFMPIVLIVASLLAADLKLGKPVGTSFWRALGVGLATAGAYKVVWRAALKPLTAWAWGRFGPRSPASVASVPPSAPPT